MKAANRIGGLMVVGCMLFVIIKRNVFDSNKLNSNSRFTIATVNRIFYPADGGPDVDFQYCVNNVTYKDYTSFDSRKHKIVVGDRFLLKYYPPNPTISRILLEMPMDSASVYVKDFTICEGR